MSSELKALSKSEKLKYAEKHLNKYISELKRHFDFSDFQTIKLLENVSQKLRKNCQENIVSKILSSFKLRK